MKKDTAKSIWLLWGAGILYFVFNSVAAAQGWPFKLPGPKFADWDRYAIAMVSVPVGLIGIIGLSAVGICYARASGESRPLLRMPAPFGLSDPESQALHAAQILAFLVLPLVGIASLFAKFLGGNFCRKVSSGASIACGQTPYEVVGTDHFRFVSFSSVTPSRAFIYQGGPDYWPFWEPIGFCLLGLAAALMLIWFAATVRNGSQNTVSPADRVGRDEAGRAQHARSDIPIGEKL